VLDFRLEDHASDDQLWPRLFANIRQGFLLTCVIFSSHTDESYAALGLVPNHAYTVLALEEAADPDFPTPHASNNGPLHDAGRPLRLVKIRNPHGSTGDAWQGRWAAGSSAWTPALRKQLALEAADAFEGTGQPILSPCMTCLNARPALRLARMHILRPHRGTSFSSRALAMP